MKPLFFRASLLTLAFASVVSLAGCSKKKCTPLSCQAEGANCGQIVDSCGGISDCGVCSVPGEACGALGPNLCGPGTCDPVTCVEVNADCGLLENGCGQVVDCGVCDGLVDGGGGPITGSGGGAGTGGGAATGGGASGGAPAAGGSPGTGGAIVSDVVAPLGAGVMMGTGSSTKQYAESVILRGEQWYYFLTNGWGPGYASSNISWNGTSFKVTMSGSPGGSGEPVGYPAAFCGNYADKVAKTKCGLPIAIDAATQIKTGWRWAANGNSGQYNAAYDIWLGNGTNLESYLMVWLRDPPGQRPAGGNGDSPTKTGVTTSVLPGSWNIWAGYVNGRPIINYVKAEGQDISEIEFDVKALIADARAQGVGSLPGAQVNSVAVGFEVWNSVTNAESIDFYVDVK